VRRLVGRYREVILAAAFVGMASYELFEMWVLERPFSGGLSLLVHAVQAALILGATYAFVGAKQHVDTGVALWPRAALEGSREVARGLERLDRAIVETRRVLMALRPYAVESVGLVEAIRDSLQEVTQETGWTVTLAENDPEAALPARAGVV
jgi:signal transduction histidine kinase